MNRLWRSSEPRISPEKKKIFISTKNDKQEQVLEELDNNKKTDDHVDVEHINLGKFVARELKKKSCQQLVSLLIADSNDDSEDLSVFDSLLERTPMVKKLIKQRDELKTQALNLAHFNYARESEFVRDRLKLRETLADINNIRQHIATKCVEPILTNLESVQQKLTSKAREMEESSESIANEFLDGKLDHDQFLTRYIELRKDTSKRRIMADKFAKQNEKLSENISKSLENFTPIDLAPKPAPRHRKRVSMI